MTITLKIYRWLTLRLKSALQKLVQNRVNKGKEDATRLQERYGVAATPRPKGAVVWLHAASVGEAQSALILIERLLETLKDTHILVTTGTVTSARMMQEKLPERAFHQYCPMDHPDWVAGFLDHWQPDLALWMESELWPNMLMAVKQRNITAALVNARLSDRSYGSWRWFPKTARQLLSPFSVVLAQSAKDALRFRALGAKNVCVTDNLKYSAKALPADDADLKPLSGSLLGRPVWVYASTHAGEEALACRVHQILKNTYPDLLTILVPRHPERRNDILKIAHDHGLTPCLRSENKILPGHETDLYIADTLGELGVFYRLCPIACIGRSFSDDGGGGHNPLEAAQLNCAVLHGPKIQFQQDLFDEMHKVSAALMLQNEAHFINILQDLLSRPEHLHALQRNALKFAQSKTGVIHSVMSALEPLLGRFERKQAA